MLKKGLLVSLLFLFCGCAGTMRIAKEDKKDLTTPQQNMVVKPNEKK
jgi:hypothetical protein